MQNTHLPKKAVQLDYCNSRYANIRPVFLQQSEQTIPDGYMTSEEFWSQVSMGVDDICWKYGLLVGI